jgi:hypothetical protein
LTGASAARAKAPKERVIAHTVSMYFILHTMKVDILIYK